MALMRAGQAIIEGLRAEGVEYIFGLVGTTTNSIVTELPGRADIRFLDTRHGGLSHHVGPRQHQPAYRHLPSLQRTGPGDRHRRRYGPRVHLP